MVKGIAMPRTATAGSLGRIASRNRKIILDSLSGSALHQERQRLIQQWMDKGYTDEQAREIVRHHFNGLGKLRKSLLRQLEANNQVLERKGKRLQQLLA